MAGFQKDYMPEMEEGSILYMPTTLPGLPSREAGWILQQMDRKLKAFPEVERVFGKLGRADSATDPAPVAMIETTVTLKPRSEWRAGMTKDKLVGEMNQGMQMLGYVNSWTQPISTRVLMQDTGIQTPVGIKVKGEELAVVQEIAQNIERLLGDFPGTQTVIAERISQGYFVDAQLDLERMAARGVTIDEALPTVRFAVGGDNVVGIRQADKTVVPLAIQYSPEYIDTLDKVRNTPVITGDGRSVALSEIADVAVREAPEMIRNDNGELAGYVYVYLRDTTGPAYVEQAREYLRSNLEMPPGYSTEWTGLYQYAEEARSKLRVVVPVTLIIMFGLLLLAFRSVADSSLIMLSAPFALVGGVFLQWQFGFSMTTAVIIGYVSLFAVAIQTGIIMIEFIREALAHRTADQSYMEAVVEGSVVKTAAQADDRRDHRSGAAADHGGHWIRNGHREANRHAHLRRDDQLHDLRTLSDPVSVCHRRRPPPPADVCGSSRVVGANRCHRLRGNRVHQDQHGRPARAPARAIGGIGRRPAVGARSAALREGLVRDRIQVGDQRKPGGCRQCIRQRDHADGRDTHARRDDHVANGCGRTVRGRERSVDGRNMARDGSVGRPGGEGLCRLLERRAVEALTRLYAKNKRLRLGSVYWPRAFGPGGARQGNPERAARAGAAAGSSVS